MDSLTILALKKAEGGGGGGGDITVESLSVSQNGTYTATTGKAYSPVTVAVPQTTVSSLSVTENGTYTATEGTAYSPVTVNVPSGGGSSWELAVSTQFTVTTSSTTVEDVGTVNLPESISDPNTIVWVHIRDKAGPRAGYFYGTDTIFFNTGGANGTPEEESTRGSITFYCYDSLNYGKSSNLRGIYGGSVNFAYKNITIKSQYNANYSKTISGTYSVEVYKLTGLTVFETS